MRINKIVIVVLIGFFFLFLISNVLALRLSNESIQARESINQAEKDILEMISRNISVLRVNESYQEAIQLYSAQSALEEKGSKANYKLVIKYASEISLIKKTALEVRDELKIFIETFENSEKEADLSEMEEEYDQIILSFNEERFEDTLELINKGYDRISEIQSSQTAVRMVYLSTAKTVKDFFIKNWLRILIIISIALFSLLIFWNTLTKLRMRMKLNSLITQKNAVKGLIKDMQTSYFKTKKISESEYNIKLKKFEELIRDIDRQVMGLKEEMFKVKRRGDFGSSGKRKRA